MHFGTGVCLCVCAQEIKMALKNCFSFNFSSLLYKCSEYYIEHFWIRLVSNPTKWSGRGEKMCAVSFRNYETRATFENTHIAKRKIVQCNKNRLFGYPRMNTLKLDCIGNSTSNISFLTKCDGRITTANEIQFKHIDFQVLFCCCCFDFLSNKSRKYESGH